MKATLALSLLALTALPAAAGSKHVIPPAPQPEPSLWSWFAGGSVGYLFDMEEPIYHIHAGVDTPWQVAGCDVALYAEVGYFELDYAEGDPQSTAFPRTAFDFEVIPLTMNVKFERPIAQNLNFYLGGGLGVSFVDVDARSLLGSASADDTVFTAQVSTGVVYNVSDSFEVYSGVRWIHFEDADLDGIASFGGDDWMAELGLRFNF